MQVGIRWRLRRGRRRLSALALLVLFAGACEPVPSGPAPGPLIAVGDLGVCGRWWSQQVGDLVDNTPGTFAPLGDLAYPDGSFSDFKNCYEPYFGDAWSRTMPALGNHEYYDSETAEGFRRYFYGRVPNPKGWYDFTQGPAQVIVLNSECWLIDGCGPGSPQYEWLKQRLDTTDYRCIVAITHKPRWSSTDAGGAGEIGPLYRLLVQGGADLLLSGHHHVYERFAKLDARGRRSSTGIRQIVVGTGGAAPHEFGPTANGSIVRRSGTHGALQVSFGDGSYSWRFLPTAGQAFAESGSSAC